MRRLAALLALPLLAAGLAPKATADDVRLLEWLGLLTPAPEAARPLLGLLPLGSWWGGDVLESTSEERTVADLGGGDAPVAWPLEQEVEWLLARGHGGDVAAALLRRIAVDAEVRAPSGAVQRATLVAAPGRRAAIGRTQTLRVVADYSAELACDNSGGLRPSAVGDPWPTTLLEGLALDVRPFAVGDDRIAMEVVLQSGRFDRPVERLDTRARFLGDVDLPRYRGAVLSGSGATAPGTALELSLTDERGEPYAVRLVPRFLDVPAPEDRPRVRPLDARFLLAPRAAIGFSTTPDFPMNAPELARPDATWGETFALRDQVWETIDRVLPGAELRLQPWGDVWLVADEDDAAAAQRALDRRAAAAARTVRVELTARTGETTLGRAVLTALAGHAAFFRLGVDRALLLDADVEVG